MNDTIVRMLEKFFEIGGTDTILKRVMSVSESDDEFKDNLIMTINTIR